MQQQGRLVGGEERRRAVMDMHKQMFVGDRSMAEPLELPGDKGVSEIFGGFFVAGQRGGGFCSSSPVFCSIFVSFRRLSAWLIVCLFRRDPDGFP